MRKLSRKILSALLALALLVSLLPIGAAPAQADTGDFSVKNNTGSSNYTYADGVLTVNDGANITISMDSSETTPTSDRIVVAENATATITLAGVNIKGSDLDSNQNIAAKSAIDLSNGSILTIALSKDTENTLAGGNGNTDGFGAPGIHVPDSASLIIQGEGNLSVSGGASRIAYGGVGIGGNAGSGGSAGESCGTVIYFASGKVTITAGTQASGSVPADDIGGGNGQNQNNGDDGQGIKPTTDGNYTVYGDLELPCDITIPQGAKVVIPEGASLTVPKDVTLTNNGTIQNQGGSFINDGTVNGQQPADSRYTINYAEETITIGEGYSLYAEQTGGEAIFTSNGENNTTSLKDYIQNTEQTLYLQAPAVGGEDQPDSRAITIPARPQAPSNTPTISYSEEKLNFPPAVTETTLEYALSQSDPNWKDVPSGAALSEMGWNGTAIYLYFRTGATDSAFASEATQSPLTIPARPEAPNDLLLMDWTDVSVTYYVGEGVQCRLGNEGAWVTLEQNKTNHTFNNLTPQTTYTIYARKPATESQFASAEASDEVTTKSSAAEPPAMTYEVTANSITLSYSAPWQYQTSDDEWVSVKGEHMFTDLEAAREYTFTVRVAESETAEASKVGTVKVTTAHAAPAANEGYAINYATETLTVNSDYEVNTAGDFTGTVIQGDASLSDYIGSTLYIRHKADANGAPASAAVALTIPARPAAPANVSGGTEQISGVDSSMEYRAVGSTSWTRCTGTSISNLSDGDYEVRIAATNNGFASEAVQVHVSPYTGRFSYEISTSVGDNGTISVDRYATEGERVTITVSPDDAYKLDDLSVTAHGKEVTLTANGDGTFTFTMPSADVKISATFAEDPDWTEPEEPATDVSDLFIDIAPDAWYKDAVQYAYDNGLMTGISANEFAPEATTTRAMIVSILAGLENVTSAESAGFNDVNDEWYATAVNWAASVGVVNGYEDNTFRPNQPITREQLAAILMNYAAYKGQDVSNRADLTSYIDQPSVWATETMQWAVAEGLISGATNTELRPQGNATRAQVAAILQRFLEA